MRSFYGGPNGQSFKIEWVFSTRYTPSEDDKVIINGTEYQVPNNSMESDIYKGWKSPIPVGSFVVISYGLIGEGYYDGYKDCDILHAPVGDKRSYSGTLWQKVYDESGGTATGITYKFITAMTGNTPRIQVEKETLHADQEPEVWIDLVDPDNPIITFKLPRSQVLSLYQPIETLTPESNPYVVYEEGTSDKQGNISAGPNGGTVDDPLLLMGLPRAVRFYYGELLGKRSAPDGIYKLTDEDGTFADEGYAVGDYYINSKNGFIYKIIAKDGNVYTFKYMASFQTPRPEIKSSSIPPFTKTKEQSIPTVRGYYKDDEHTEWILDFELPKAPLATAESEAIGASEEPEVEVSIKDTETLLFDFKLPKATRMFVGQEVSEDALDAVVEGANTGDLYLNTATGEIYMLLPDGTWEKQTGSIKGPTGDPLHIVRSYSTYEEDTYENGRDLIINRYVDEDGNPYPYKSNELFAITFIGDGETTQDSSYWYFFVEDGDGYWARIRITGGGGILSGIENSYVNSPKEDPITDKTYSIDYLNKLVGGDMEASPTRTTFSKTQILGLMSWGSLEDAKSGNIFTYEES